jgi:DNA repair protein RadD
MEWFPTVNIFTMLVLRDDQQDLIDRARAALRLHRRILVQSPTGSGKTVLASHMATTTSARGGLVNFICHRRELIHQTSLTFHKFGISHGFIAAGRPMNLNSLVNICSVDTLKNRVLQLPEPRLALWDEGHHLGAAGWKFVQDAWPNAYHVILSATPWRLDGSGLGDVCDYLVPGPSVAWLIERGFLSPYRMYAPGAPDMRRQSDFVKEAAAKKMDKPALTGDAISHWKRLANGLRTIVFCATVAHSQHVAAQFTAAGIPAAHLDGTTPKGVRDRIIMDYAAGRLQVLTNVALFGEGFDLGAIAQTDVTIDCVIDLDPTLSLSWCLQKWGRALRPYPGKVAIIIDHAGNSNRHGFPDDDREWTLEGRDKDGSKGGQDGPPPPVTCEKCFIQVKRPLPECCPGCGKRLQAQVKPPESSDDDLVEMTDAQKRAVRGRLRQEQAEAKSLGDLVALAKARGYKSPQQWAFNVWANRPKERLPGLGDAMVAFDANAF